MVISVPIQDCGTKNRLTERGNNKLFFNMLRRFLGVFLGGAVFLTAGLAQERAPSFELVDYTGELQRLEDYRGKIVVLNFWATWCVPCASEMPIFVELQQRYAEQGVAVLAASFDDETTQENIPEFMQKTGMNFPVLMGTTMDHLQLFGMALSLPGTVFVDREGYIVFRIFGEATQSDVEDRVAWLLGQRQGEQPAAELDHLPDL